MIDIGGEACVYDSHGCPAKGLTNALSHFDDRLGRPGKIIYPFLECAEGGESIDLWLDAGCNDLFGELQDSGRIQRLDIAVCDEEKKGRRSMTWRLRITWPWLQVLLIAGLRKKLLT